MARTSGSKNWRNGSSWKWRKVRAFVLARDGFVCQIRDAAGRRLPGCTERATTGHHTVGRGVSGDDPRYLVAACKSCNQAIGDPSRGDPPLSGRGTAW